MKPAITLTIKFRRQPMKRQVKVVREGKKVVPNLKKVAVKATKVSRK